MSDGLEQIRLDNPGKHVAHVREEGLGHCGRLVLARACGLAGTAGCRRVCNFLFSQLLSNQEFLNTWSTPERVTATIATVGKIGDFRQCSENQWINEIEWKAAAIGLQRHIIIVHKEKNIPPSVVSPDVRAGLLEFDELRESYAKYVDTESVHKHRIRWEKFGKPPIVAYNVGYHYNTLIVKGAGSRAII